jgi:hypothetical protein
MAEHDEPQELVVIYNGETIHGETCEACQSPRVVKHDVEGVPFCQRDWDSEGPTIGDRIRSLGISETARLDDAHRSNANNCWRSGYVHKLARKQGMKVSVRHVGDELWVLRVK